MLANKPFSPGRFTRFFSLLGFFMLSGCASTLQVGPVSGGRCQNDLLCVAHIQDLSPTGGRIVSAVRGAVWTGRDNFISETQNLARQNCLSRGFTGAVLQAPIRLPDLMVFKQIQTFTCQRPPTQTRLPPIQEAPKEQPPTTEPGVSVESIQKDRTEDSRKRAKENPQQLKADRCRRMGVDENSKDFALCMRSLK